MRESEIAGTYARSLFELSSLTGTVTDAEALAAFEQLCVTEGIIPAIESAHALALLPRLAEELGPSGRVVVNVSGRGDKDIDIVREAGLGA